MCFMSLSLSVCKCVQKITRLCVIPGKDVPTIAVRTWNVESMQFRVGFIADIMWCNSARCSSLSKAFVRRQKN